MKRIIILILVIVLLIPVLFSQRLQNKEPKLLAQKLYQALHLRNKKMALQIADKDAVDKLFSLKWRPMKFESCNKKSE